MADKNDDQRLIDLKAALKSAKRSGGWLSLMDCAALWGVSKPRFVNKRAEIADFPEVGKQEGNAHFYPEKPALRAMIGYLERHQKAAEQKAASRAVLIGGGGGAGSAAIAGALSVHSVSELATLNRLAAELEEREREQGLWVLKAEVSMVVGDVFSEISDLLSNLANKIDPHGNLPAKTRAHIDTEGKEKLLVLHGKLKDMMATDADHGSNRTANARSGRAPTRRKPKGRRQRPAG